MSVLVKGMEMPSSCSMCPMAHRNYRLEAEETQLACYAKGEWVSDDGERPVWCPLIELPPHGRLIDADALEDKCHRMSQDEWNKSTSTTWGYAYATFESEVEDAPTIIPADKEKDDD